MPPVPVVQIESVKDRIIGVVEAHADLEPGTKGGLVRRREGALLHDARRERPAPRRSRS